MIGTAGTPSNASLRFLLTGACWSAGLLIVLGSSLGQRALVAPFAAWHAAFAVDVSGGSPVVVDLSCSGSDVIALVDRRDPGVSGIVAPAAAGVAWRSSGCVTLNLARIVTLVDTAGSPLFVPLHLTSGRRCPDRRFGRVRLRLDVAGAAELALHDSRTSAAGGELGASHRPPGRRLCRLAPWLLVSPVLQRVGDRAREPACVAPARRSDRSADRRRHARRRPASRFSSRPNASSRRSCRSTWRGRSRGRRASRHAWPLLLFVPLFVALGFVRLLTVALPSIIGPPLFLTHGFYQIVTARARRRRGGARSERAGEGDRFPPRLAPRCSQPRSLAILLAARLPRTLVDRRRGP